MIKGDKIKVVGSVGKIKPPTQTVSYQIVSKLGSTIIP
jgi:hypothetical protein